MSYVANELLDWAKLSCRFHLKNSDFLFIKKTLSHDKLPPNIWQLFDEDLMIRQYILDSNTLFNHILESPGYLPISLELYFYVLIRKNLRQYGFDDPKLTDYIVAILVRRMQSSAAFNASSPGSSFYISDALELISSQQSKEDKFFHQVLLANQTLFFTSLFEDYIKTRTNRKGAPDIGFFQSIGESQYLEVCQSPLASEFSLQDVFQTLAYSFGPIRCALSKFSERLISFGEPHF